MLRAQDRYRIANVRNFHELLSAWLATLPRDGWEGTVGELEYALCDLQEQLRLRGWITCGNALGVRLREELQSLENLGFAVAFRRTASARTISLSRIFVV